MRKAWIQCIHVFYFQAYTFQIYSFQIYGFEITALCFDISRYPHGVLRVRLMPCYHFEES